MEKEMMSVLNRYGLIDQSAQSLQTCRKKLDAQRLQCKRMDEKCSMNNKTAVTFLFSSRTCFIIHDILLQSRSCFDDWIHILMVIKINSGPFESEKEI